MNNEHIKYIIIFFFNALANHFATIPSMKNIFRAVSKLFLKKWKNAKDKKTKEGIVICIIQFRIVRYSNISNWYEGIAIGYSVTNNGTEGTNGNYK